MNESSTRSLVSLDGYRNITDLLVRRAAAAPEHLAFDVARTDAGADATWDGVTTAEYLSQVRALAKGLMGAGVEAGDAVAIMAPTRYEWAVADLASWFAGAVVVPIYDSASSFQVDAIVADADVRLAIGGNAQHTTLLADALAATPSITLGAWPPADHRQPRR